MKEETTNEKLILQAAEEAFLQKGYSGAKTTAIAQKAGVTHAMLHYYFRTKENLFQKVFQQKAQMIGNSFEIILDETLPFEETIRAFVEKHFDFVVGNTDLVSFVYNEVKTNKDNGVMLRKILSARISYIFNRFEKIIEKEVAKGRIKPIKTIELFITILTVNLSSAILFSALGDFFLNLDPEQRKLLQKKKKEDNVQYILFSLKNKN